MMRRLNGIVAVYFDAVGTVIFPTPTAAVVYASVAARHRHTFDAAQLAPKLWQQFRAEDENDRVAGWATSEERERTRWRTIVSAALPESSEELFTELFEHFARPSAWAVPDDAAKTLLALQTTGLQLGMASNYDLRLQSVVRGTAALAPVQDRLIISSVVGVRKPGHRFFEAVIQQAECEPGQILFVGDDAENDYAGAVEAGLRAVLLDPNQRHPEVPNRIHRLSDLLA
jgi:putative hydrolase of the HAD superfamily